MMGRTSTKRLSVRARACLKQLDRELDTVYKAPEAYLENKQDPLEEAVYIILSCQTGLDRFKRVWGKLRQAYPTWEDLSRASIRHVSNTLRIGGLQTQKATTIQNLLKAVSACSGDFSLDWLNQMNDEDVERALTRLPGLSLKAARCVMLYSLNRSTFPVDVNTFRVFKRVGILSPTSVYRRRELHDSLQLAVEPSRRKAFHINLVVHGQRICLPRRPLCSECAALRFCAMRGVPEEIRAAARRTREQSAAIIRRVRITA